MSERIPQSAPPPRETVTRDCPDLPALARILEQAAQALRRHAAAPPPVTLPPPQADLVLSAPLVRAIIEVRRRRADYFPEVPGDHAFSMLLELYAARLEGRRLPQTRLGSLAGVPHATAIRIARALQTEAWIDTATDPADRRLNLLALTEDAAARMEA